jgi:uncharacterized membrane protein YsdA (DUF1294 family)
VGWLYVYLIWLAAFSLVTFILYGVDKSRARRAAWRIPEATLHWMALLGGFPGGWAGRAVFRHKTQKTSFVLVLAFSTIIHLGLVLWVLVRKII